MYVHAHVHITICADVFTSLHMHTRVHTHTHRDIFVLFYNIIAPVLFIISTTIVTIMTIRTMTIPITITITVIIIIIIIVPSSVPSSLPLPPSLLALLHDWVGRGVFGPRLLE